MVKNPPAMQVTHPGLIPRSRRSPEEGNGYPLQYSCLDNSMDRGTWWAIVHGVAKSWTRLNDFHFHYPRTTESETLGGGHKICVFNSPPGDSNS